MTEQTSAAPFFEPSELFIKADPIVQAVIIVLFIISILSWAIIIERWRLYHRHSKQWLLFSKLFWSGKDLRDLTVQIESDPKNPFVMIFMAVMREYTRATKQDQLQSKLELISQGHVQRFLHKLEHRLSWLAAISSGAPFIGLLGTVWGIMHAFRSIALAKQSHLAIVAPGIAEALFATAIGLFAAIPAGFAYNLFVARKERLFGDINQFANDLLVTVLRHQHQQ